MKRTLFVVSVLAGLAAGCGKKKEEGGKPAPTPEVKPPAPPAPAPPPAPYTGKLTAERIMGLKQAIGSPPPLALAEALARAKGQAGEPTKVDGERYGWAVLEGDSCAYAIITAKGDQVSMVQSPQTVGKDGPSGNLAECKKMAGIEPGPPEDPNAAAPPADGSAVTTEVFRTTAVVGRSKWKGQEVKVSGVVTGITTSTSGSDSWTTVSLKASDKDTASAVSCYSGKNAVVTAKQGDAVIASGKVKISEWTSGGGETTLEAGLEECAVEPAPKADKGKKSK